MPFKYDAAGNIVTAESDVGGKKVMLPVFVHPDGAEKPFDADSTVSTISRLNGEARDHRVAKETAEGKLKVFEGLDPVKAKEALEIASKLSAKQLVDAGEIDKVRSEISTAFQAQIDEWKGKAGAFESQIFDMTVGSAFSNSKFVKEKLAAHIPPDFIQAKFGSNFGVEAGKLYGVDASGNKLYSKVRPGEIADFDEALSMLVESHPQRDALLRGSGGSGGGSQGGSGGAGGKRTMTRAQFEALPVHDKPKVAAEVQIVD